MLEYMRTVLNGLKAWVTGEVNNLLSKIDAVGVVASRASNVATKNKNSIGVLRGSLGNVATTAEVAQNVAYTARNTAETAQSTAETAQSTAETAQSTAENAQRTANFAVKYESQNLTDSQKSTARSNIGAVNDYDLLKNRPCYVDTKLVYTGTPNTVVGELYYMQSSVSSIVYIASGGKYLVNGKSPMLSATRVIIELSASSTVSPADKFAFIYCIGNLKLLDQVGTKNLQKVFGLPLSANVITSPNRPDNGLDFCVGCYTNNSGHNILGIISKTSDQLSVYEVNELKTLEESMIPDSIARVSNLTQTVQKIESTDQSNMVSIRSIDSGTYILYGYFKPYAGADSTMTFSSNLLVNILKGDTESHVQVFYPYNNCVQYLKITDSSYERKDMYLNSLMSKSDDVVISSSIEGSTKKFKLTVDDAGTLSATEVTT